MITDLWIENFKGIGKRQHIPLRPITLLFGANSAGKSTVLHALAYLREILCHNNTNPTKSLGGSQTVNLGGFSNLVHQPGGKQVTIGARSEGWKDVYNEHYFLSQNVDEPSERKQKVGDVELSPWTGFAYHDTEPPLTIEVSVSERQIDKLEFHVHGTPSVVLWSEHLKLESPEHLRATALQVAACVGWIDVWCGFLIPECIGDHSSHPGTLEDYHQSIHEAGQERRRAAVEWLSSHLEPLYEPLDIQIPSDATLSAAKPLASLKILDIPTFTSELPDWLLATSASVPLDAVLAALLPAEGTGAYKHVDGEWSKLFVVLHRPDTGPSAGCVVPFCLIGDPKNTSHFLSGLSQLRVACCRTPFAAAWKFPSFQALISSPNTPLNLGLWDRGSDSEINQHLLSKLQALIDAMVRGSLSSLQDLLQTSIYIGPKRSTVPRHLNSSMMDEYSSWADGLGAWRWMTTCAEKDLASCARWLGDKVSGLGTNFTLVRETFYDVDSETVYAAMYKAVSKDEEGDGDMFEEFEAEADSWPKSSKIVVKDNRTHLRRHPQDIGEGITQVIPVIASVVQSISESSKVASMVNIEQPELHLHPSLAARLGDLFLTINKKPGFARLLIETHSEHLILRILRRIRQTTDGDLPEHIPPTPPVTPDDVCVLWVDNLGDGTTFTRLRISDNGRWLDRWPDGFFSERHEELFE